MTSVDVVDIRGVYQMRDSFLFNSNRWLLRLTQTEAYEID